MPSAQAAPVALELVRVVDASGRGHPNPGNVVASTQRTQQSATLSYSPQLAWWRPKPSAGSTAP
jgi:hypothetical protein